MGLHTGLDSLGTVVGVDLKTFEMVYKLKLYAAEVGEFRHGSFDIIKSD